MKIIYILMALFSAFFISKIHAIELDMDDLRDPKLTTQYCGSNQYTEGCGETLEEAKYAACQAAAPMVSLSSYPGYVWTGAECIVDGSQYKIRKFGQRIYPNGDSLPANEYYSLNFTNPQPTEGETCPPDGAPFHIHPVAVGGSTKCAKEKETEFEPDDKCDEFGLDNWLPENGTNTQGSVCYTNPITGKQCQYSKNDIAGYKSSGQECTGEEPPYGDKPDKNEKDPDQPPNCESYGSNNQSLMCEIDPNKSCNVLQVSGQVQYQCPAGCGSMEGKYYCAHEDKDGNKIPDDWPDGTKPEEPKPPTPPDDTTPPQTSEPPTTEGTNNLLNSIGGKIDGTNSRLDGISTELFGQGQSLDAANQKLDGINSGIQGMKELQKGSNGLLSSISNSNEQIRKNTGFTADSTADLLDSFEDFKEDFGQTDIEGNFDPAASTSFYESEYEEGFEGVWNEKSELFKQTEAFNFLQQFAFNSGGTPPDTQMCFNLGASMDFGCAELPTPSPQLLAILKVFILITAAFLCRALIFGG